VPKLTWLSICGALVLALVAPPVFAQDGNDARPLTFFDPVQGTLTASRPADEWTFEGHAGQVVSLVAATMDGSLDPVLTLIGPDEGRVAENDDLDSLVRDAGLEALALPQDGVYTVRVARYDESTSGTYQLTLTPGFAGVVRRDSFDGAESPYTAPENASVVLAQGRLRVRVLPAGTTVTVIPADAEALDDLYIQATTSLFGQMSYAEFGLVFRAQTSGGGLGMYAFKVNTEGRWTVSVRDASGEYVLRTWTADEALSSAPWTLGVLARGSDLSFFANGVPLGTLSDSRLPGPGTYGLLVGTREDQPDPATILFDDVIVTRRLGTTYRGLPLALTTWDSNDPALIAAEIAESGQVVLAPARDLFLLERTLSAADPASVFELLGSEQALYEDFILGANVTTLTTGESVGCGAVFRWQDERNLDLAYVDTGGGFGVVQARDAELSTNVYDQNAMVNQGLNRLIVIAQADRVSLYINGALVTQEQMGPGRGRVGLALLNYEDAVTDCAFGDIWVWPLATDTAAGE